MPFCERLLVRSLVQTAAERGAELNSGLEELSESGKTDQWLMEHQKRQET